MATTACYKYEKKEPLPTTAPITEATVAAIPSLTTLLARAFHPTNPYIRKCLPDTPAMRAWWTRVFTTQLANPSGHILVALAPSPSSDGAPTVIGALMCTFMNPTTRGAGSWSAVPIGPGDDHDGAMYDAMIGNMVRHRERLMLGRRHLCVDLLGVESGAQGGGVGRKLLSAACELADGEGVEVFVQANGFAKAFYQREGFVVDEEVVMPGDEGYVEVLLVRPARERGRG